MAIANLINRIVSYSIYSLVLTFSLTIVAPHFSQAQLLCPEYGIQQITNEPSGDSEDPSISGDGRWVAFSSRANINGGNPGGSTEVFFASTSNGQITQITNESSGPSDEPSTNRDGSRIAYESGANPNGNNPNGFNQIYYYDRLLGTSTQVTVDADHPSSVPSINADGNIIAFQSTSDHAGNNPDNNSEIFTYNIAADAFSQITDSIDGGSAGSSISGDGTIIAFRSSSDLTGQNPLLVSQLFFANTALNTITQLTNITGDGIFSISTSADGMWVSFFTKADVIGQNPENDFELFLVELSTGTITQITDTTAGGVGDGSINANGELIAFESRGNHVSIPPDGNREIFVFDTISDSFTQLTDEPVSPDDDSEDPSIDYIGTKIAFRSEANINGGNPDGNREIFLARCDVRAVPTLSEWGLIAMAGLLGIVGFMVIRRRTVSADI